MLYSQLPPAKLDQLNWANNVDLLVGHAGTLINDTPQPLVREQLIVRP